MPPRVVANSQGRQSDADKLCTAVGQGNAQKVKALIASKVDVNQCDTEGRSALFMSTMNDQRVKIVKLLLDAQANPDARGQEDYFPLYVACQDKKGHAAVSALLAAKADVNLSRRDGTTALMVACNNCNIGAVEALLEAGASFDGEKGEAVLQHACQSDDDENAAVVVSALIAATKDDKATFCRSALSFACILGRASIVTTLLTKHHVDPNVKGGKSRLYPLVAACHGDDDEGGLSVVKALLAANADIDLCGQLGITALYIACSQEKVKIASHLIAAGADVNCETIMGYSMLSTACEGKDDKKVADIVKALIAAKADIHKTNLGGRNPLQTACGHKNPSAVKFLIDAGADPDAALRGGESTALGLACQGKDDEDAQAIVSALLSGKADVNKSTVTLQAGGTGGTALHAACYRENPNIVELLLAAGASVVNESYGKDPLYAAACESVNAEKAALMVSALLLAKADINHASPGKSTPLITAIKMNKFALATLLLDKFKADPDAMDRMMMTPLGHAVINARDATFGTLLLQHGATPQPQLFKHFLKLDSPGLVRRALMLLENTTSCWGCGKRAHSSVRVGEMITPPSLSGQQVLSDAYSCLCSATFCSDKCEVRILLPLNPCCTS
jgi:ankyrin repeat protein